MEDAENQMRKAFLGDKGGAAATQGMEVPEDSVDENDPAFGAAMELAMKALYEGGAAKDVATQLKSSGSVVEGLANVAYEMTSVVDERTDGQVPDELIVILGASILQEVADIAEAAGMKPSAQDVAEAFKQMLLRFLGEQGVDTTQLQQAMDEVDPAAFNQVADEGPVVDAGAEEEVLQ
jgi:hypothetical protein